MTDDLLHRAHRAFEGRRWREAAALLADADAVSPLGSDELERLATAAYLAGDDETSDDALTRAHQVASDVGDAPRAVRGAFWLGLHLAFRGDNAQAGGWFARAMRLVEECGDDCVERSYLLIPMALQQLDAGQAEAAHGVFLQIAAAGERHGDVDLATLGRLGLGQAAVVSGDGPRSMTLLDEAMVAVTAGEVSPAVAGIVYCGVIEACRRGFDLRRAHEWTDALTRWCDAQPDLVPYRGQCLVHRSEIFQLDGRWGEAIAEAERACTELSQPPPRPAVGSAWYQRAELQRLRGTLADAERSYREANRFGRDPQPGLALLRLAEGNVDAAVAAVRRVISTAVDASARGMLLPAWVEVLLAAGDVDDAAAAAGELGDVADTLGSTLLRARANHAVGAVRLARGDAEGALTALREAKRGWAQLAVPYDAARSQVLAAEACAQLGDEDTASLERDQARGVFEQLGADTELEGLAGCDGATRPLTGREVEVLRLVSTGTSNKGIAAELVLSERTVERHVSNIFAKLGVASRTAAAAWAYEHRVV